MDLTSLGFESNYRVTRLEVFPSGRVYGFRRGRQAVKKEEIVLETKPGNLVLKVIPSAGDTWVGSFESGPEGMTGLFSTPSPEILCVVAKGQGFLVHVLQPHSVEIIKPIPIKEVFVILELGLLVFADYTKLAAYGSKGLVWETDRLSWDGIKIAAVTPQSICGTAWDSPNNREVPFSVDPATGISEGGSSPSK